MQWFIQASIQSSIDQPALANHRTAEAVRGGILLSSTFSPPTGSKQQGLLIDDFEQQQRDDIVGCS